MITDITPAYTWNAESNSTWYYLWVDDGTGNRITQWYTAEEVAFDVWNGSYWVRLEKFSKNNDTGNHCSHYYNLTPYRNAVPLKILFHTNNSDDMKNGDKLMIDDITIFAW